MVESLLICVALLWIFKQVRAEERANPRVDIYRQEGVDYYRTPCGFKRRIKRPIEWY